MTIEVISQSIFMKVWDWADIKLMNPGSAVRFTTECATGPSWKFEKFKCDKDNGYVTWLL